MLLCFVLGCFGVDRFPLGRIGLDVAELLLGRFPFGRWLIDVILICCRMVEDGDGRPLS